MAESVAECGFCTNKAVSTLPAKHLQLKLSDSVNVESTNEISYIRAGHAFQKVQPVSNIFNCYHPLMLFQGTDCY